MSEKPRLDDKPQILTSNDMAEVLRVSRRTINQLVAANAIPFVRIGRRTIRFKREAVMKWFREQRTTLFVRKKPQ